MLLYKPYNNKANYTMQKKTLELNCAIHIKAVSS